MRRSITEDLKMLIHAKGVWPLQFATWLDLGITEFRVSRGAVEIYFGPNGYIAFCPNMQCLMYMGFPQMNWNGSGGCYCDEVIDATDVIS